MKGMATGHKHRLACRLCLCYSQRDISTSSPSLHYHYFPVWQFAHVSICPCEHLSLWAIILVSINPCEHSSVWAYIRVSIYRCGYFSCEHSWQWGFICAQLSCGLSSCGLLSWNRSSHIKRQHDEITYLLHALWPVSWSKKRQWVNHTNPLYFISIPTTQTAASMWLYWNYFILWEGEAKSDCFHIIFEYSAEN
jgi:hypothetical protein